MLEFPTARMDWTSAGLMPDTPYCSECNLVLYREVVC